MERYNNEILRVFSVLEGVLAKDGYLVGGRLTISDLAFISWNYTAVVRLLPKDFDLEKEFPAVAKYDVFVHFRRILLNACFIDGKTIFSRGSRSRRCTL